MSRAINKFIFVISTGTIIIICLFCYRHWRGNRNSDFLGKELKKKGISVIDKTKKLEMTEINQTEIQDISMMICTELRRSSRDGNDITKLPHIKNMRHLYCKGEDWYYAVLKDNYGRKLFVFFDDFLWFDAILYMEKPLKFKDFKLLEEGVSTKDEVRKIDSGIDIEQSWGGMDTISNDSSLHMTKEGVVEILYNSGKIKKINFHYSSLIKKLYKCGDYE